MQSNTTNKLKRNIISIAAFLLLVVAADFIVGKILKHFYQKQTSGWDYGTRYSVEETTADVVLLGASRAQQQYNPQYFEDTLHLTCYNAGRDGMPVLYHYGVLQGILKRYTPKAVVLDCEFKHFRKSEGDGYDRISTLLPFYKDHPEMRSTIELKSPFEKYKLLSSTYPYNSLLFRILIGNTKKGKKKNATIKGYIPLERSLKNAANNVDYTKPYELDSTKVKAFTSIIDLCQSKGVKIFLVCGPYYYNAIGTDVSMATAKEIAAKKNVPFLDYSQDSFFLKNPALFDDTIHVNKAGSQIISSLFASQIKKGLSQ